MLRSADLTYTIQDGIVIVTTTDDVESMLEVRVYNCRDLIALMHEHPGAMPMGSQPRGMGRTGGMGGEMAPAESAGMYLGAMPRSSDSAMPGMPSATAGAGGMPGMEGMPGMQGMPGMSGAMPVMGGMGGTPNGGQGSEVALAVLLPRRAFRNSMP